VDPVRMREANLRFRESRHSVPFRISSFAHHLPRRLVLAQSPESGVPHKTVGGPRTELHLGNELRLHAVHASSRGGVQLSGKGGFFLLDFSQPLVKILRHRPAEPRADTADMPKVSILEEAKH